MNKVPTPHINSKKEDIAKTVIMPGDPNRSKFIAENFLEDIVLVNNVRGVKGYTGKYKGKRVTVMASGMGNASMGIYSHELFDCYNVEKIIRVGSCGANSLNINLGDIVITSSTYTNTNFANLFKNNMHVLKASKELEKDLVKKAKELGFSYYIGSTYCTDTFYNEENQKQIMDENKCIAVEMESAALYYNAQKLNKKAITICSVSDNILTGENLPATLRETYFKNMITLALEIA